MPEIAIDSSLLGVRVCLAARPEWGAGTVQLIQTSTVNGEPQHRVTIDFPVGRRVVVVPPARRSAQQAEPQRSAGWLDTLGKSTLDDKLRTLPESATDVLGSPAQRLAALAALFRFDEEPASRIKWARAQTGVADPLTHWSRDELDEAFAAFAARRNVACRELATTIRRTRGQEELEAALSAMEPALAASIRSVMR